MAFLQLLTKKAKISEPSYILKSKKRESWYLSNPGLSLLNKEGGYLLSRIALQYHRRWRA